MTKEQLELSKNTVDELFNILKKRITPAIFLFTVNNIMNFVETVLANLVIQFMVNCIWQSEQFKNRKEKEIDKNIKSFCKYIENGILEELYKEKNNV